MKKILFFSPYWGRTGSELLLKECIMLVHGQNFECAIAGRNKGVLYDSFPPSVRKFDFRTFNFEYEEENASPAGKALINVTRFKRKTYGKLYNKNLLYQFLDSVAKDFPADIWYINTVYMPDIMEYAAAHKIRVILHCHELERILVYLNVEQTYRMVNYPEHIISVASENTAMLKTLGRRGDIITIHPFIHVDKWQADELQRNRIRAEFGIGEKSFIWAMSGELDTNKDPLIFVEIAAQVIKNNIDANFIWFGGGHQTGYSEYARKKAEQLCVANKITWTGPLQEGIAQYFGAIDGMMLTSQRDSFPLVMIEAAAMGKPIVSFDSGGITEFLNDEKMGIVVKLRSIKAFCQALEQVMRERKKFDPGTSIRRATEFDISNKAAEWKKFMSQL